MQNITKDIFFDILTKFSLRDYDVISFLSVSRESHRLKDKFSYNDKYYTFEEKFTDLWYGVKINWGMFYATSIENVKFLPSFIKKLSLIYLTNNNIKEGDIPNHISTIEIGNLKHNLEPGMLPESIKILIFSLHFCGHCRNIIKGSIPFGTKYIDFETAVYFNADIIPNSVEHITVNCNYFGKYYDCDFSIFPKSLKTLEVKGGDDNDFFIESKHIPPWITKLFINSRKFCIPIPEFITHLYIGARFADKISSLDIPPSVKHLILERNYQKYHMKKEIPNTLESITLHKSVAPILPQIPKITYY